MKEVEQFNDLQHFRILTGIDDDDSTDQMDSMQNFMLRSPNEECQKLVTFLFEESHQISFCQFTKFQSITDLNLLKRSLSEYSDNLQILDENKFTDFFIGSLPHENKLINDSMFSIYTNLVSKYYTNLNYVWQIILECIKNFKDHYYAEIFTAICATKKAFNEQWNYLYKKLNENMIQMNYFLRATSSLIKNKIYPPDREQYISTILSDPIPGIFTVFKVLKLTREEIQRYKVDDLLVYAFGTPDIKITADALVFLGKKRNVFLLTNPNITNSILKLLNSGNFQQKQKILVFFDKIICGNYLPSVCINEMIQNQCIEISGEMLLSNSNEIQFVSLRIIYFLICVGENYSNEAVFRCNEEDLYNSIYELTMSENQNISSVATAIIRKLAPLN